MLLVNIIHVNTIAMNKNKLISKLMRYILVAMLALLPNAMWGLTETTETNLSNGSSFTLSVTTVSKYVKGSDYWALSVIAPDGTMVNDLSAWSVSQNGFVVAPITGQYLKVNKTGYDLTYQSLTLTAPSTISSLAHYKIILLVSKNEAFYNNPSEVLAEKKVTFDIISKDDLPKFSTYSGSKSAEKLITIADADLEGGSINIEDLGSTLLDFGIWGKTTDNKGLSLTNYPFYLRLSVEDKDGNPVTDLRGFTLKRNGTEISDVSLGYHEWNLACYKNAKGVYCLRDQKENYQVSFSDINFSVTCPNGKKINDYNIVVYVGNEQPSIMENLIFTEPTLVGKVNYTILSQTTFDAIKLTTPSGEPTGTAVRNVSSIVLGTNLNVDLTSKDNLKFIKEQLGLSETQNFGKLYVRWAIKKKDGSAITGVSSKGALKQQEGMYWTWYSDDASSSYANALNANFVVPEGLDVNDVDISCVISDETPTTEYGFVTTEPTLKAKVNVQLLDKYSMPFNHYKGHANTALDEKGMQQTAEWEYYVYVKDDNEEVELVLPFDDYHGSSDALEPQGYFRWYNFTTDRASANLKPNTGTGASTLLNHIKSGGEDYGLFAYNLYPALPTSSNIGVTYTAPAGASSKDWKGEDIACDVSRYIDGLDASKTYLLHEPTLSIRYIFHIRSAKQLADDIMKTAIGNNLERAGYRTYEDGKYITVGMKDQSSTVTLRLDLPDATKYYFHPLANGVYKTGSIEGFTHRVYYADENDKLVESDFDVTKLCKATKIEWWAYDKTKTYCKKLPNYEGENTRFFDLSMGKLNGDDWKPASMTGPNKSFTFEYGDPVYIVAYAMDGEDHRCPIANFDVRFMNEHPMTKNEIVKEGLNNRLISYLDEHYKMATKPITFDDDDVEQTVAAPTTPDNNQDRLPSKWDRRAYSFVYRDLIDYDATYYNGLKTIGHSPLHGDYCLYKSANLSSVSTGTEKYLWWSNNTLYDKTYEMTNGSQYGHFLYVDASDESRKIAASDFTADLCTGQQLIFIAAVADMTNAKTKPQIMFKLFGVNRNVNGEIVEKHLIHSFSSGDFDNNRDTKEEATWYQVYGKITLQKESNVEQYSDFRLEIDNYCKGTDGADYAIDDIRMYLKPAKVEIYQDRPACGETGTGSIKLKIRAIHETLNAILNHKDTKIHYRLVNEDGTPVTGEGLYNYWLKGPDDATAKEIKTDKSYASVDVFDSEEACAKYEIDGVNMIEKDADGETYIILANHQFKLTKGKKYYVSICADSDPDASDANWGKPSDVCSIYSVIFEMIGQTPIITDTDGKVITEYRVNCTDSDPKVKLTGSLTTIDPVTGEKITLTGVPFLWYIDNSSTPVEPTASNIIEIPVSKIGYGAHKIYMKPETGKTNADGEMVFTVGSVEYLMCTEKIPVPLRIAKDGPQLNFGFNNVDYPFNDNSYEASLRIGLPQIKKLLEKTSQGYLQIPLHSASYKTGVTDKTLTFIDDSKPKADKTSDKVYVATTNDPLWDASLLKNPIATLSSSTLAEVKADKQYTLDLKFFNDVLKNFHEGYYYDLRFVFEQKDAATAGSSNCYGESYLKVKIVPEFITWTPTADGGMNANWNNDANWHRSSSAELYDNGYKNYLPYGSSMSGTPTSAQEIPTLNSYVPMKFTKVTIANLNGLPFPDLGNIVYRSTNQIATKLTNGKGNEATKYIRYDIMAYWNEADANKGFDADGNLKCEKFYGNTCHQIYFKPQGELRDQCYLVYDKAWVEKELVPNKWYTMASPLQYIYAGDMYVPASNGRQETPAFTDITFDDKVNSRSKYPVYQRAWMKSDVKEITPDGEPDYDAWHKPAGAPSTVDMNLGYWSHVYNKVNESYSDAADGTFGGFSIKAGNALLPKDQTKNALLRLPKADMEYQYFDYNGTGNSSSKTSVTKDPKGHGKLLVAFNNDEKHLAEMTQSLGDDNTSGFYLVANPYTCSISMAKFFEGNSGLQKAIWIVENGEVKAISGTERDMKNYAIQPTQSFFVKKNASATIREVKFTSTMCVDRTITPGLLMASDYVKTVEVETENSNGQTSKARIALRPEASADYDDEEDVDLLYDQNLKYIPQVYTVAGNEAVAVNAVPELSWIPLGIVSQQAEEVSLTLKGVNKLDAPVYLYDAASASFTELHEGEAVKVKAGDHGRYFLTQTRTSTGIDRMEAEEQSAPVKVYSPAAGMIVVSALGGEKLDKVQVFTMDGKMVHSYQLPDKQRMILRVTSGIYIVKASTQSCAQAKGQKIAVR